MLTQDDKPSANRFAAGAILAGHVRGGGPGIGMTNSPVWRRIAGREGAANARN